MKKTLSVPVVISLACLIVFACLCAAGCSGKANASPNTNSEGIDVDLTRLSSTMLYAEVNNILANPDEYMGKTVRMSGPYASSYYEQTGLYYHYIVVQDNTSCCIQGLEFIWNGEHDFPDDYPDEAEKIEVTGVFANYDELGKTYYFLSVDELSVI